MLNTDSVFHSRYLPPDVLFQVLKEHAELEKIGHSVEGRPIYALRLGKGPVKLLAWSQMHGNESTTTRGLFDFYVQIRNDEYYLSQFTFVLIFQLNPDGAQAYTRYNANQVDLNRDALAQTQPETQSFMKLLNEFSPDLCLNLHDQRTRFTVGETKREAAISFLAPAADEQRLLTDSRRVAMDLIGHVFNGFNQSVQQRIARFDDCFNLNCFGDYLANRSIPTILIEAGQWGTDYDRVLTRRLVCESILGITQNCMLNKERESLDVKTYLSIPENTQYGYDEGHFDPMSQKLIGVRYNERLDGDQLLFEVGEQEEIHAQDQHKVCFRTYYAHSIRS
ncbi:MAG: M14 family zinc carboxypeptidase [Flavobacteriaceae bacterium]